MNKLWSMELLFALPNENLLALFFFVQPLDRVHNILWLANETFTPLINLSSGKKIQIPRICVTLCLTLSEYISFCTLPSSYLGIHKMRPPILIFTLVSLLRRPRLRNDVIFLPSGTLQIYFENYSLDLFCYCSFTAIRRGLE